MKPYPKSSRSIMLMEALGLVSLIGTFSVLAMPVIYHLIRAIPERGKIYDQFIQVDAITDRIRADLHAPAASSPSQVLAVEPRRLLLVAGDSRIEYRATDRHIQRLQTIEGTTRLTAAWKVAFTTLTFSREPGKPGAILVRLHWQLGRPAKDRRSLPHALAVDMDIAAHERSGDLSLKEVNP